MGQGHRRRGGAALTTGHCLRSQSAPRWAPTRPSRRSRRHPSSRARSGAILLGGIGVLIVAVILVAVLSSGGSSPKKNAGATNPTTPASSTTATVSQTTTPPSTTTPQILAQLDLTSPTGASKTVGVAHVIRDEGVVGIVIDAQGIPANTAHNAYAVWLYNSPSSHSFAGFVQNLVGKNGRLAAQGQLPAGASRYHHLLITLETAAEADQPPVRSCCRARSESTPESGQSAVRAEEVSSEQR